MEFFAAFAKKIKKCQSGNSIPEEKWKSGHKISVDILGKYKGKKFAIEYDGGWTHRNKAEVDTRKANILLKHGYKTIRIRDVGLPVLQITDPNFMQIIAGKTKDQNATLRAKVIQQVVDDVMKFL